jgi:hypothetical protein
VENELNTNLELEKNTNSKFNWLIFIYCYKLNSKNIFPKSQDRVVVEPYYMEDSTHDHLTEFIDEKN